MNGLNDKLLFVYADIKKQIPNLNHLSFEISDWNIPQVYGFYHIGEDCEQFDSIEEFQDILATRRRHREKNEILFRKFDLSRIAKTAMWLREECGKI